MGPLTPPSTTYTASNPGRAEGVSRTPTQMRENIEGNPSIMTSPPHSTTNHPVYRTTNPVSRPPISTWKQNRPSRSSS
ncbi:hypothetical protein GCM10008012_23430 [Rhizobium anhuiense]|nr:hypothetical protein GCM10008012_23430 [Rhizobium anhuiense]